jgi:hypothetical protein
VALAIAAVGAGIAKSGVPGLVTVITPFVAMVIPARMTTGLLLPLNVCGDIISVLYWRRKAAWPQLMRILPWSLVGIVAGYFFMKQVDDITFRPILGGIIVSITVLAILRNKYNLSIKPENKILVACIGFLAGMFTLMANAAAPLITMYLVSQKMTKEEFVGTNAWFFFVVNLARIPFSIRLGIITLEHFKLNLMLFPLVILGAAIGISLLKRIPQKTFLLMTQALALIAGIRLLF